MAGLKFRVLLDSKEQEQVFRDILISDQDNFESFYKAILKAYDFKGDQMGSFYMSNDNWDKGHEISLMDMTYEDDAIDTLPTVMNKAIIKDFFHLPVKLDEFVGEWLSIEDRDLSRLGSSTTATLGMSTIVGRYVWGSQHKFRLIFGPLSLTEYESLLPSGARLNKLIAIIKNYIGYELQWDVNLILKAEDVQGIRLGGTQQLGWTSWLGLRTSAKDANPLVLNPLHESF